MWFLLKPVELYTSNWDWELESTVFFLNPVVGFIPHHDWDTRANFEQQEDFLVFYNASSD